MKLYVLGARNCFGNKKAGGSFEFSQVFVGSEISDFSSDNFSVVGSVGMESAEISCSKEVVNQLHNFDLPCSVEFETTTEMKSGQIVTVLSSVVA